MCTSQVCTHPRTVLTHTTFGAPSLSASLVRSPFDCPGLMAGGAAASMHTVFSAECNAIFDWHSVALFHSHAQSGQPGGITRLLA